MSAVAFQFEPEGHTYSVGGRAVPSVTQILQAVGLVCYEGIPEAILDHKAEVGTAAHAACHYHDEGDLDWATLDGEVVPYVEGWLKFRKETDFVPRLIEKQGVAEVHGMKYGYTLDREGTLCGRDTLLEIKCTAGVEISWGPQTAAYDFALRAQDGKVRARVVVHLKPNGTYALIPYASVQDYQVFQWGLAIETWKRMKGKFDGFGSRRA